MKYTFYMMRAITLSILMIIAFFISAIETYQIRGDSGNLSGSRLRSMMSWRLHAESLPKLYRDRVIVNMDPSENVVYLTFDDGPDLKNTPKVIDTLMKYGVSATFYFLGELMENHHTIVKKAHDAGFSIGLHGYDHTSMRKMTQREIYEALKKSNDALYHITGSRTTIMRPPFGDVGATEIETIVDLGYRIHLWSLDTVDWYLDTDGIFANIENHIRPGDIILMHSGQGQAKVANILPRIIEYIQKLGFEFGAL
jgi:peptidoglycan/xylan/chitin deacetylase (PgdA/CDA1 family)